MVIDALSYRQQVTPERLLSRVNTAGRMVAGSLGWTIGALGAGALVQVLTITTSMMVTMSVGIVAVIVGWCSPLRTGAVSDVLVE